VDPLQLLAERLRGRPELAWTATPGSVRIEAPATEGFAVELVRDEDQLTVFLGDGASDLIFEDSDEALNFVAWCFSGEARLRQTWRGDSLHKCVLEGLQRDQWQTVETTVFPFVPFWRSKREVILRNPNLLRG
jgi:hypothetical protein